MIGLFGENPNWYMLDNRKPENFCQGDTPLWRTILHAVSGEDRDEQYR
ncbi:hypothetical protein CEV33_4889 [Brucella grignonensis]|uniref:Uncharacterized protein n=1 Tax=Brucella grignonensis TaxID=94627 RepID=A0A256FS27_9HYPH|nr:hypothetical protein CEV33_4889 [Brucella grignonensis]